MSGMPGTEKKRDPSSTGTYHTHIYIRTVHTHIHNYINTHIHKHKHTYIHTYIHAYTKLLKRFYWAINLGSLIAYTLVSYICQYGIPDLGGEKWGFFVGYSIPAIMMGQHIHTYIHTYIHALIEPVPYRTSTH